MMAPCPSRPLSPREFLPQHSHNNPRFHTALNSRRSGIRVTPNSKPTPCLFHLTVPGSSGCDINNVKRSSFGSRYLKLGGPVHGLPTADPCTALNFSGDMTRSLKSGFCGVGYKNRIPDWMLKSLPRLDQAVESETGPGSKSEDHYDAIVIGSGIGGLVAATQLAVKGARVLVLEKYVIPGGSSGFYQRGSYTFDVGSSVMFGFSDKGNLNLITQALEAVGCEMQVIPDPTTVHFHLPENLSVRVHREYSDFLMELTTKFPHEKEGIIKFYGECWKIFNALNSLELKSLEEPIYLFGQFFQKPIECLTLAYFLPQNAGDIARKFIKDPHLLSFIDAECFIVSTVNALKTPMINASMVVLVGLQNLWQKAWQCLAAKFITKQM